MATEGQPAYRIYDERCSSPERADVRRHRNPLWRLLKEWRNRRGLSQLDLALAVRTTQRHLSFIESGRAVPSRDMILRLSGTMDIPLRQQNALLLAAGYAPVWRERDLLAPDLAMVNTALDYMLGQHEPYPAFVVDRRWNLLRANCGAVTLTEFLLGPAPVEPAAEPVNLAIALMSSEGLRPFITNWEEVAHYFLRGVQADAQADGAPETLALLNRLLALPDVAALADRPPPAEGSDSADAFSTGRQAAQHVHDDCHVGHSARRNVAGSAD